MTRRLPLRRTIRRAFFAFGLLVVAGTGAVAQTTATAPPHPLPGPNEKIGTTVHVSVAANRALLIDASAEHHLLQLQERPRSFPTLAAFVQYCITTFHGRPIYDKKGNLVGAIGGVVVRGDVDSVHPTTHAVVAQPDPILAQIGGWSRKVVIGTKTIDLSRPVVRRTSARRRFGGETLLASAAGSVNQCSGGACTKSSSSYLDLIFYKAVGSSTTQTSGGFQQSSHFCWKDGWIPWSCTTSSGSNSFAITNQYYAFATPIVVFPFQGTGTNVSTLTVQIWAVGGSVDVSGQSSPPNPGGFDPLGTVGETTGVCGGHSGTGVASQAWTQAGKVGTCPP